MLLALHSPLRLRLLSFARSFARPFTLRGNNLRHTLIPDFLVYLLVKLPPCKFPLFSGIPCFSGEEQPSPLPTAIWISSILQWSILGSIFPINFSPHQYFTDKFLSCSFFACSSPPEWERKKVRQRYPCPAISGSAKARCRQGSRPLHVSVCPLIYPFVCTSVSPSICLSINPSVRRSILDQTCFCLPPRFSLSSISKKAM